MDKKEKIQFTVYLLSLILLVVAGSVWTVLAHFVVVYFCWEGAVEGTGYVTDAVYVGAILGAMKIKEALKPETEER